MDYDVPTEAYPTIQAAIDTAAVAGEGPQFVNLIVPRVDLFAQLSIGTGLGPTKPLTVRPKPGWGLDRPTVGGMFCCDPILEMNAASQVTIQDLDLIRYITNDSTLMWLRTCTNVVIERCRIGSVAEGLHAHAPKNLVIADPSEVVVRNCILFSWWAGNFNDALEASLGNAQNRSLFLYNNIAADYLNYGFNVGAHGDALVVCRNNIAVNRMGTDPEPTGFYSAISEPPSLVCQP